MLKLALNQTKVKITAIICDSNLNPLLIYHFRFATVDHRHDLHHDLLHAHLRALLHVLLHVPLHALRHDHLGDPDCPCPGCHVGDGQFSMGRGLISTHSFGYAKHQHQPALQHAQCQHVRCQQHV